MVGGATLTGLLGTSAWYAPGAAVSTIVQAIACDQKKMIPCSVMLNGEYGLSDICMGAPVIIGRNGVEKTKISDDYFKEIKECYCEAKYNSDAFDFVLNH